MGRRKTAFSLLLWAALIGLVIWAWARFGISNLTAVLTVVSGLVGLLPILKVGPLRWSVPGRSSSPKEIDEAAKALAIEVRKQWDEEARRRRLQESRQMPVRWEVEDRSAGRDTLPPTGQLPRLVDEFAIDPRPMVVIGEPGSGKTGLCVILTLDLLTEASPYRVPVLLQISSWDPAENLDEWLVQRLVDDYPFLGNESRYGGTAARELVAQRRVLPILDGLDEMPAELRPAALKAIEDDWSTRPFVLTCRTEEFRAANARNQLVGVLVIRLLPLEPQAAANYLLEAAPDASLEQWEPVLADVVERPAGSLAVPLTKPLMLFLARTAFAPEDASPRVLLDEQRFGNEIEVEEYLLDSFIPAVFRTRPPRHVPSPTRPSVQWDPAVAERALTFLATFLHARGTRDLAWWQLGRAVPSAVSTAVRVTIGTLGCGLLAWILFGLFGRPMLGLVFGLVVGFVAALPLSSVQETKPRRFVPRILRRSELTPQFLIRDIGFGLVGAVVGGLIVGLIFNLAYGIVMGLFFGLIFGLVRRFTEPTEPKEPVSPVNVLYSDRSTVLYALLLGGFAGALVGGFLGGVIGAQDQGLIFELTPVQQGMLGGAVGLLVGAGGLGMMVHATSAWGQFVMARIWLAYKGYAPLRLVTFLRDAHKLGVLRQVGPMYQFRHALLQERLVERAGQGAPAVGAAAGRLNGVGS
jgi:hypothetical protein